MAQLNNLLVSGSSRLLNTLYCKDISVSESVRISGSIETEGKLNIGKTTAANAQISLNNKVALTGNDSWLRINNSNNFSSGIYCGSGILRTDGTFQVGDGGRYLSVTSSRFDVKVPTYMTANLYMGSTTYYFNTSGIINASTVTTNGANIGTLNCTSKAEFLDVNVKNTLRSVKWDINNVANLGGTFYVAPTLYFSSNATVTVNAISGTSVTLTILDATTISSSTAAGVTWYASSKIKLSGKIGNCVLGTADGTLSATMHSTANSLKCVVTIDEASKLAAGTTYSGANISNLCVMMYSLYSSVSGTSAARPVGIAMTSYGTNKSSAIDIYGGTSDTPNVRIGLLTGISDTTLNPSGWGIYASNGYFKGRIVATSGKIGSFNISTRLYTYNNDLNNTTIADNVYIGENGISLGKGQFKVTSAGALTATSGLIGGFSLTSSYLANGTSTLAGAANSVYLGTDGISCGTSFKVTKNGILSTTNAIITGDITATNMLAIDNYKVKAGSIGSIITIIDASGGLITSMSNPKFKIGMLNYTVKNEESAILFECQKKIGSSEDWKTQTTIHGDIINLSGNVYINGELLTNMFLNQKDIKIQMGRVSITPIANTPTSEHVSFTNNFSSTPYVVLTPITSVPGKNVLGVGTSGNTKSGFDAYVTRTNTTETILVWIAIGPA